MNLQTNGGMQMTKKLMVLILAVVTAVSMVLVIPAESVSAAGSPKVKVLKYKITPSMNSLKVSWKKQKNVSYYLIYKTEYNVKDIYKIEPVPMSKFKKVKKVSGKKTSWTDKKVKKGRYYNYVIRGYKKSKGKTRMVCNSFKPTATYYNCPGLQRPDIFDGGDGENYSNTRNKLYLYVQRTDGVRPDGVTIYRKAAGASKYKKIKAKKMEKGRFNIGSFYRDSSVKPGKTYSYKARTWVKKNGKKKYSPYSNVVTIPAVNHTGTYTVKAMTAAGTVKEFSVRMTSDKYNGILYLKGGAGTDGPLYEASAAGKLYDNQKVALVSWSKDNKTWLGIPSAGLQVKAGQTVYLKFRFVSGSAKFLAGSGDFSDIDFMCENVAYMYNTLFGYSSIVIRLKEGKAYAYPNADL